MGSQADATGDKPDLSSKAERHHRLPIAMQTLTAPRADLGYTPTPKVDGEWEVQKVLDTIPGAPSTKTASQSPVAFFHMIERLKTTKREGWRRFGINRHV